MNSQREVARDEGAERTMSGLKRDLKDVSFSVDHSKAGFLHPVSPSILSTSGEMQIFLELHLSGYKPRLFPDSLLANQNAIFNDKT